MDIEVGKTYTAYDQGRCITPQTFKVIVVWIENDTVHYRHEGRKIIYQTPLSRFTEIVTPKTKV